MQSADILFFEEYKRLDTLCSDMFSCHNGVSAYIAQMERAFSQGRYRIPPWDSDYKMLKHVRWVRNQIAHNSGTYQMSEPEDLNAVQDFYDRILSGTDSLALLRKTIQEESKPKTQKKPRVTHDETPAFSSHSSEKERPEVWIGILVGIGILALIFLLSHF